MNRQTIAPIMQIQQTNSLIRTKFHLSEVRKMVVSDLHLEAQFEKGFRTTLTMIMATAGFGKTTLITSCLASVDCQIPFKNTSTLSRR